MARRRHQAPKPKKRGAFWTLRVREDEFVAGRLVRRHKRIRLAPSSVGFREAERLADEYLEPMNRGTQPVGSAVSFADYVKHTYIPVVLPIYASTTRDRYKGVAANYLVPEFGHLMLRSMTSLLIQEYFSQAKSKPKLSTLSHESVDKIRDVLSSILESTRKYGLLKQNPMDNVDLARNVRGRRRKKPYLSPQQFALLVSFIQEPYATMIFVAIYTGLRVSELIGLRWEDIHENAITIDERCCRGDWAAPKSEASNATIAVNRCVIERLEALKTLTVQVKAGHALRKYKVVKSSCPEDLVFQSVRTGAAMRDNNILSRHLKPAGRKLGFDWVNWRCMRTSHSTWLRMAGADIKDRQAQMRHANASTTLDIYEQFVPESQVRAVNLLSKLTETVQ